MLGLDLLLLLFCELLLLFAASVETTEGHFGERNKKQEQEISSCARRLGPKCIRILILSYVGASYACPGADHHILENLFKGYLLNQV